MSPICILRETWLYFLTVTVLWNLYIFPNPSNFEAMSDTRERPSECENNGPFVRTSYDAGMHQIGV